MDILFSATSHRGHQRKSNEDCYFVWRQNDGSLLLAVADGMGGAPGGAEAATFAIAPFAATGVDDRLAPHHLPQLAMDGHEAIRDYAAHTPEMKGMGTTLTAALLQPGQLSWVHIGDSRLYLLQGKTLRQLTADHRLLDRIFTHGKPDHEAMKRHPLRSMLDQCLGGEHVELEVGEARFARGDCLLLCTDGLHDELAPEAIAYWLSHDSSVSEKTDSLVQAALSEGGNDNITVIVAQSRE